MTGNFETSILQNTGQTKQGLVRIPIKGTDRIYVFKK